MLGTAVYEKVAAGEITLEQLRMLEQVDEYSQLGPDQLLSLIADSASSVKAASSPKRSLSATMGIEKAASPVDDFNGNEDRAPTPEEQEMISRAVREHMAANQPRRVGAAVEAGTGAAMGDLIGNHVLGLGWGPIPAMLGAGRNAAGAGIGQFAGARLGGLAGAHTSAPRAGALLGAQLGGMAGAGLGAGAQEYATWQPPAPRRPRTPTATSQAEEPKTAGILGTDWDADSVTMGIEKAAETPEEYESRRRYEAAQAALQAGVGHLGGSTIADSMAPGTASTGGLVGGTLMAGPGARAGAFGGAFLGGVLGRGSDAGEALGPLIGAGLGAAAQKYLLQPPYRAPQETRAPPKTAGILGTDWDADKLKQTAMDATIRGGIGLGLGAAATGAYRAMSGLADKMTSRRDLGRILAVHPQINQGNTPEQVDLAYQSLRRFAPHLTKDPLAGGNALGTILRSTDPLNPSGPPRLSGASVAQELSRLSPQRDPAEELISGSFQSGASSALRAQDDRAGKLLSHDLARDMETNVRQPFQTQRDDANRQNSQAHDVYMEEQVKHPLNLEIKDLQGVRGQNSHLSNELNRTGREHSILWGALRQSGMSDNDIQDLLRPQGP